MINKIVAHRGFWKRESGEEFFESNSLLAINLALKSGWGIEIDIRDQNNELIICHNPPTQKMPLFNELNLKPCKGLVALNLKSSGLHEHFKKIKGNLKLTDYFFFDLSYPEEYKYSSLGFEVATRRSEYEETRESDYVWVDSFSTDWWMNLKFLKETENSKSKFIIVSPELHKRNHKEAWKYFKRHLYEKSNFFICTDYPLDLQLYLESYDD